MTLKQARDLETKIKDVCTDKTKISHELVDEIRKYLVMKNGELDVEACAYLRGNTDIKLYHKRINELNHDVIMVGVSYNNQAIEFYNMPCLDDKFH